MKLKHIKRRASKYLWFAETCSPNIFYCRLGCRPTLPSQEPCYWLKVFIMHSEFLYLRCQEPLTGPAQLGVVTKLINTHENLPRFIAWHCAQWKRFSVMHSSDIPMKASGLSLRPVRRFLTKSLEARNCNSLMKYTILCFKYFRSHTTSAWTMWSCIELDNYETATWRMFESWIDPYVDVCQYCRQP